MIIIVEQQRLLDDEYTSRLEQAGFAVVKLNTQEFEFWALNSTPSERAIVKACLFGDLDLGVDMQHLFSKLKSTPKIALLQEESLEYTLSLFEAGIDDVLKNPVSIRELLARISAIASRRGEYENTIDLGRLKVFLDGRDPQIDCTTFPLPRRERRILEYLASLRGRRANKDQLFNAIYGLFNEQVNTEVIESHVSRLRKKLRQTLGYDPINSKRYLGYCIALNN